MDRPEVLLNCAVSLDGRLAGPDGSPLVLSGHEDLRRVHGLRAACDAILVGVSTVLADDPSLRVRPEWAEGPDPLRVVLDGRARTPLDARVLADGNVLLCVAEGTRTAAPHVAVPRAAHGLDLTAVLHALAARGVRRVLVEGGGHVLQSFVEAGLWDRWTVYQAPVIVGGGPSLWPRGPPAPDLHGRAEPLGPGALWSFSR